MEFSTITLQVTKKLIQICIFCFIFTVLSEKANANTLEALFDGEVSLLTLIESGTNLETLEIEYKARVDPKESNKFLKNSSIRKKMKKFQVQQRIILRDLKRRNKSKPNKNYSGDPNLAEDANPAQIAFYKTVKRQLKELFNSRKINDSTLSESILVIDSLERFHRHNSTICREYYEYGESETYMAPSDACQSSRPPLHPEDKDVPFSIKAGIMYEQLKSAYDFAFTANLVSELFTDLIAKGSGCMEGRFKNLFKWHKLQAGLCRERALMPQAEQEKFLLKTAQDEVNSYIEAHHNDIADQDSSYTRDAIAEGIVVHFSGKIGTDGASISKELVLICLNEIYGPPDL